jgi:hypothetical protein
MRIGESDKMGKMGFCRGLVAVILFLCLDGVDLWRYIHIRTGE